MLRLAIHEAIPSLNKGEAAILGGILEALTLCGEVELTVYSPPEWFADDSRNYSGSCRVATGSDLCDMGNAFSDNPVERGRFYLIRLWAKLVALAFLSRFSKRLANRLTDSDEFSKAFINADVILASHDGMLGYGCFFPAIAATAMGKPHVLFGGGHDGGHRESSKARLMLQYAVRRAALCTVRDMGTQNYLVTNGIPVERARLFPDPAVLLRPCGAERARQILVAEGVPEPSLGSVFALIPVEGGIVARQSFSDARSSADRRALRVELWASLVDYLIEATDAHFVFLPHCTGPIAGNDDRRMNRAIYEALRPQGRGRVTLIDNEYSASDLKGVMGRSQFVLGERTHALIGALSAGTPAMALTVTNDRRMHDIVHGMFGRVAFDLDHPDLFQLREIILREWGGRLVAGPEVKAKAQQAQEEGWKAAALLREACLRR
jgi:polysaccharide pyruvyl transferase WcaK-like protein